MGVKLAPLLSDFGESVGLAYLEGKKLAIDSYPTLYQMLATIRDKKGRPLQDSEGRITSHLVGLFNRTAKMISQGIRPIFIFDGPPYVLKKKEVEKRTERREKAEKKYQKALKEGKIEEAKKYAQQAIRVEENIEESAKELLHLLGVPVITAPHDAEAQASYMTKKGMCFGVASPDYDAFLFGSSKVIRNLRMVRTVKPKVFDLQNIVAGLAISHSQLIDVALLLGTDFNEGVKGIGPKRALKLVKKYSNLQEILSKKEVEWPSSSPPPQEIITYFQNPPVKEGVEIEFGELDREAVCTFLVGERDFSRERVERRLDEIEERKKKEEKRGVQASLDKFTP